ncbi:MAG TPA: biopolymer transporter ExbD [Candidatus Krumholzibacteria bacterium]|nr:biopolymer transporter ExbD [Candidatus Krumholzibacteria bacterium]
MEIGTGGSLKSDINVTPLVDVMLVMLIIFMVVTPLLHQGIEVTLPKAKNVQTVSENEKEVLVVGVTAGGQIFVGDDPVELTQLVSVLTGKIRGNPALQLQIRGDRNAHFKDIRQIVKAGRDAGFASAAMIAEEIKLPPAQPVPGGAGAGAPVASENRATDAAKGASPWP